MIAAKQNTLTKTPKGIQEAGPLGV